MAYFIPQVAYFSQSWPPVLAYFDPRFQFRVEPNAVIAVVCYMSERATTRLFGWALSGTLLTMLMLNAIVR